MILPEHLQSPNTLRLKQSLFAYLMGKLLTWLYENGYEATVGDFKAAIGHSSKSLHYEQLAADLNVFKATEWLNGAKPSHIVEFKKIGAYWKSLHALCRWGGDFKAVDLNHFSLTPDGKRA